MIASDVNPHACASARDRGVEAVRADLVSAFADGAFDAVVFNPPYLPTDPDNEWDDWMERALSGGESAGGGASEDPIATLGKLHELLTKKIITQAEFDAKKAELLKKIT